VLALYILTSCSFLCASYPLPCLLATHLGALATKPILTAKEISVLARLLPLLFITYSSQPTSDIVNELVIRQAYELAFLAFLSPFQTCVLFFSFRKPPYQAR
jgi:hypothetical protein